MIDTTTRAIDSAEGIVTERVSTWERHIGHGAHRRSLGEQTTASYDWHASADCSQIGDLRVVERGKSPRDSLYPVLTCEWCVHAPDLDTRPLQGEADIERPTYGTGGGSRRAPLAQPEPTEKQVAFYRSLLARKGGAQWTDAMSDAVEQAARENGRWTKRGISALIDALLTQPDAPTSATTDAPAARLAPGQRANRYSGTCPRCHQHVAEGAGRVEKQASRWVTFHLDGACPATVEVAPTAPAAPLADVPSGHYAITSTGSNDLAFYRIDRPTEGQYAGRVFVKMIVGGHPEQNVRRDAIPGILDRIAEAGIAESGRLYGQEIGRCCRCNRALTDEESRRLGIGPDCRKRG